MNLLLLENNDFIAEQRVRLSGRRLKHLTDVHRVNTGDTLKAGKINGKMGTATVVQQHTESILLDVHLTDQPPEPLPLTLILALPRPKMLRRIFQTIATMGVKQLYLINSWRVEKSYWQTPWLDNTAIREQLILGLEQGCDTTLPDVFFEKRFKPFVEDTLPKLCSGTQALVAHPSAISPCPSALEGQVTLAVGPEGGFIDYEIEKLQHAGFQPMTLGQRILRVETAIPVLLARIFS
jgi:16S rRNA (uracil1498-N3)-methyltransferase